SPSPAASVSARCSSDESSGAIAAAGPPCAQALAQLTPSAALVMTTTGAGASSSAAISPASPAPMMTGRPARSFRSGCMVLSDRDHAFDGKAGALGDFGRHGHFGRHRLQRVPDIAERDPLHMRAEIARLDEFDIGIECGD